MIRGCKGDQADVPEIVAVAEPFKTLGALRVLLLEGLYTQLGQLAGRLQECVELACLLLHQQQL